MPGKFISYLQGERARLDLALSRASLALWSTDGDVECLRRLRAIVDEQIDSWSRDLADDTVAA